MSTTDKQTTAKDIYGVYQQNVDKVFTGIKQQVPRYHQSVTNAQQEYLDACENIINSSISLQREYARKAGITTNVPDATLKVIRDTTEEIAKVSSIQNKIALAAIDASQQNIKTFNENAKSFAELNKNILQSWISALTTRNY